MTFDQYMAENGRQAELDLSRSVPGGYERAADFYRRNGYYGTNLTTLNQRDLRWANKKLGYSNYTLGTHGCTVTTLTNLMNRLLGYNLTPDAVNDKLKTLGEYTRYNQKGAFLGALLVWANIPRAYPALKGGYRDYNYNNFKVAWYIYAKKIPVMVEVNAASIGASKHWVLYIGGRLCVDPWIGKIVPTSTYPATGDAVYTRA